MRLELYIYLARSQRGHFEASIPWIPPLATPMRGQSPAQLKEEIAFRLVEMIHGGMPASELDRLLPPSRCHLFNLYIEREHRPEPGRPEVSQSALTHVIVAQWQGEQAVHVWIPRLPGVHLVVESFEDGYLAAHTALEKWLEDNEPETLEALHSGEMARMETFGFEVDFPPVTPPGVLPPPPAGRRRRPEALQQIAINLLHRAEDDTLGPCYGREALVEELVNILTGPRPSNICLVGPPGSGKTAIVHEVARRLHRMRRTWGAGRDLWQTSGDRIIAGMSIVGQWEQRTEAACRELAERGDILVVEDLLGLVRAGRTQSGDTNVARFVEPYLHDRRFAMVAEANEETFELARQHAPGFVDRFRRIHVPALDEERTLAVLNAQLRALEEDQLPIRFAPDGVENIVRLARRFYRQEAFPGKAVRLAKQCYSEALRLHHESQSQDVRIDAALVAGVVHRQSGLPMSILRPGFGRTPKAIEAAFASRIFGQPEAVEAMCALVLAMEQGLSDPRRPLGSFLFIGPSGVGKTETARALAADLFGSEDRLVRFDMSEFAESLALSRLIGTPQHPDGELTGRVRMQPFSVILLDEVEKAHPRVLDLLLQLLGDGRLSDAGGRTVDFCNTVVLMTSNLGAGSEERWMGFSERGRADRDLHYRRSAEAFFRPELFNRIDRVIAYRPLEMESLRRIARRTVRELLQRRGLRQAQMMVDVNQALVDHLVSTSLDKRYGARALAQTIEKQLITPLAQRLVSHGLGRGLTRVTLLPGPQPSQPLDIRLQTIAMASPTTHQAPALATPEESMILAALLRRMEGLRDDARLGRVDAAYDAVLARLNEEGGRPGAVGWNDELAENLRQLERFRDMWRHTQRRAESIFDARQTGTWSMPSPRDRALRQKIDALGAALLRDAGWLEAQLDALLASETAESEGIGARPLHAFVMGGLSGPYGELLGRWRDWLESFAGRWELGANMLYQVGDQWIEKPTNELEFDQISAFAILTQAAGVAQLFGALQGYIWSPRAPSHGQHALLLGRHMLVPANLQNMGAAEINGVLGKWQNLDHLGAAQAEDCAPELCVEFVESNGNIEDLRLQRTWDMPEARGARLAEFATDFLLARLAAAPAAIKATSTYGASVVDGTDLLLTSFER